MRDHWYPLCDARDIPAGGLRADTLLGDPVVLFRDARGMPACLEDLCPHRSAPLSIGRVEGGRLECRYHGWQYDDTGRCVRVPSRLVGASIPDGVRARAYPCRERAGLIWVWPGAPEHVDDSFARWLVEAEGWSVSRGVRELKVDHGLVIENLLDLSHSCFTHDGLLADRDDACGLEAIATTGPQELRAIFRRTTDGVVAAQTVDFEAPCAVRLELDLEWDERRIAQVHYAVPLSRGRTRWFWQVARNWLLDMPALDATLAERAAAVVDQDARVLCAQQARIDQGAPLWGCAVPADAAAVAYRDWRNLHEGADTWFAGFGAKLARGIF